MRFGASKHFVFLEAVEPEVAYSVRGGAETWQVPQLTVPLKYLVRTDKRDAQHAMHRVQRAAFADRRNALELEIASVENAERQREGTERVSEEPDVAESEGDLDVALVHFAFADLEGRTGEGREGGEGGREGGGGGGRGRGGEREGVRGSLGVCTHLFVHHQQQHVTLVSLFSEGVDRPAAASPLVALARRLLRVPQTLRRDKHGKLT